MKVLFDGLVCSFVAFMLLLAIFNYYNFKLTNALVLSVIISVIFFALLVTIKNKKRKKELTNVKDKKNLKKFTDYLRCSPQEKIVTDLYYQLKKVGYMPTKEGFGVILPQKNIVIYTLFKFLPINQDQLIEIKNLTPAGLKTVLICTDLTEDATILLKSFQQDFIIVSHVKYYKFLKEYDLLNPENYLDLSPKKVKLKTLIKGCFNRKKSRHFFYIGLIMLVFSFFVFYPKYYLIMGTLFCGIGFVCLLYGKTNN